MTLKEIEAFVTKEFGARCDIYPSDGSISVAFRDGVSFSWGKVVALSILVGSEEIDFTYGASTGPLSDVTPGENSIFGFYIRNVKGIEDAKRTVE